MQQDANQSPETGNGKRYLGKAAEAVTIRHSGGATTAATWVVREAPKLVRNGILVQQRSALTYANIGDGDEVVDSSGLRWVVIEVQSSSFAGQHPLSDVRLGAVEP